MDLGRLLPSFLSGLFRQFPTVCRPQGRLFLLWGYVLAMKALILFGRSHVALLAGAYFYACSVWVGVTAKLLGDGALNSDWLVLSVGFAVALYWLARVLLDLGGALLRSTSKALNPYFHISLFVVTALVFITSFFISNLSIG